LRSLAVMVALVAALAFVPPATAATQLTYRYGPIDLAPFEVDQNTVIGSVPKPNVDGFITAMEADLVDARGQSVSPAHVMLHHIVFLNLGQPGKLGQHRDWTCNVFTTLNSAFKVPALADRFYASGEERNALLLPDGYGYPVKGDDNWVLLWMLMSHHPVENQVYIQYKITYETERQLTPAYMVWLDVENCLQDPVFDVPGGGAPGSTYSRSATWTAPMSGRLVAGGGHLHGGGKSTVLSQPDCGNRELFTSRPLYGLPDNPVYQSRPVMHEPGPINMSGFLSQQGLPFSKGQRLQLTANYDNRWPHTRVMGIFGTYFAPDPAVVDGCAAAPSLQNYASTAPGRRDPPRFKVPLARKPVGRVRTVRSGATIGVSDFQFKPERVRVRRGALLRWRFRGSTPHDVTVASGPRGFSSPNLSGDRVYRKKLKVAGTYRLYCTLHPTRMVQEIEVTRR
jgi:plastocyanin